MQATAPRTSGFPKKVGGWDLHHRVTPYASDRDVLSTSTWSRLCGDVTARRRVVVQIRIRRNEIDMQSFAVVEVLDRESLSWNTLVRLGTREMAVHRQDDRFRGTLVSASSMQNMYGYQMPEAHLFAIYDAFKADEENLLGQAASLIDAAL